MDYTLNEEPIDVEIKKLLDNIENIKSCVDLYVVLIEETLKE